ncbi:ABC transporter ATP-binding protein [Effusibacillus lacus]|uniref:Sulfonate ABC transporter ATP-binding protein n=1 Tax=Effusibacillus lacus TaxID=1348429 RepID=A0A292YHJ9_9BACL|nr:ABC transporter ATP-binding protein [Effusibacillus lacus]TCS76607.1 NitT/TauT family transport system ATP-binding protein [Effusibacillus lacus]GAX90377.1 sulfonate ABC transporter ATP-binding protein [Effusibacillus lacus]
MADTRIPLLKFDSINVVYNQGKANQVHALKDVSGEIHEGEFVSIIGPSGCGKSTLLHTLDGLIKPTSGSIHVNGRQVEGPGGDRAMVFQDFALMPWHTVYQNVAFGLRLAGKPDREIRERVMHYIQLVGLEGFEGKYPHQLSGGMKQRVGIARAFAVDPKVLLMDEPFSAIDEQTREIMQEEVLKIMLYEKKTVIFITHSIDEAVFLSNRIFLMSVRPGKIVDDLKIDVPYPRTLETKTLPEYQSYKAKIWDHLKGEVARQYLRGEA